MNKSFLLAIGMLAFALTAKSQSHFGLKAGVNLADQVKTLDILEGPSTEQDTKPFLGYQVGAFYKANLHTRLMLSAEINFSVIGSGMTLMSTEGKSYNAHEKLGYIDIPVTIQYKINKIYFGAGPAIGLKMLSKITNFLDRSYKVPYYRTIDASGNLLAGFNATEKMDINVRYSHGLVNLYADPGYAKAKNKFLNLSLLYSLK